MTSFTTSSDAQAQPARSTQTLHSWLFHLGDVDGGQAPGLDASGWRTVHVPHDWSVELEFTQEEAGGATGYLPGGIGWYRHTFTLSPEDQGKRIRIEFDGVYNNADTYINGQHLGMHPYGYSPYAYDLTEHLHFDGRPNVIAVRVDRSAYLDCRWYPGSGIYRDVSLVISNPIHIPQWGVFIKTPSVTSEQAGVRVAVDITNTRDESANISVATTILGPDGQQVDELGTMHTVDAGAVTPVQQTFKLDAPALWSPDTPSLYTAVTRIVRDGEVLDETTTRFGIRDVVYDPDKGFFLNGKQTLIKGVCLHHDGGAVGAAVPEAVWRRRLATLREAGVNAIRTAHNPPSAEFLDLCDEMGFLVQDEAFDEWHNPKDKRNNYNQEKADRVTAGYTRYYEEWAERDIKAMVLRDRNHPSIIMWSIGNEIEWTYPNYGVPTGYWKPTQVEGFNYYFDEPPFDIDKMKQIFAETDPGKYIMLDDATDLARWVREVDDSRAVTANLVIPSVCHFSGVTDLLDIIGYSYRSVLYGYGRRHYPEKLILGTENWVQWHEWEAVLNNQPAIPGIFLWTGIDYMGEAKSDWPRRASGSGMLNLAGFKKPGWHMFRTLWNDEPYVYMTTTALEGSPYELDENGKVVRKDRAAKEKTRWGWHDTFEHYNYEPGQAVVIETYINCPEAELFLNGKSLGRKKLADYMDDHLVKWHIPEFEAGELQLVGYPEEGAPVYAMLRTAQAPATLDVQTDASVIRADRYESAHITVELNDSRDVPVRHEERRVHFEVTGPGKLLGVCNGSAENINPYQSESVPTYHGRALAIIQSTGEPGLMTVRVSAEGMPDRVLHIDATDGQ